MSKRHGLRRPLRELRLPRLPSPDAALQKAGKKKRLWCKLSQPTQRCAREHYAAYAARTAFQISGAVLPLMRSFERELTFPDPMHEFNTGDGDRGAPKALQSSIGPNEV